MTPDTPQPRPIIVILEDDINRIRGFAQSFQNTDYTIFITDQVDQCIEILSKHKADIAYLDHDLGGKVFVDPDKELTGLHVARWIAEHPDRAPVACFIHSHNPSGAKAMANTLNAIKTTTTVIAPFPACLTQYQLSLR